MQGHWAGYDNGHHDYIPAEMPYPGEDIDWKRVRRFLWTKAKYELGVLLTVLWWLTCELGKILWHCVLPCIGCVAAFLALIAGLNIFAILVG